jgi:hypothetical protein
MFLVELIAGMFKLIGSDGKGIGTNCEKSALTPAEIPLLKTAGELNESGASSDDAIPLEV